MYELGDITLHNVCAYIQSIDVLVVGDVHIGYESNLAKQGVLMPRFQFDEILDEVSKQLERFTPDRTIVVGDLKHEFGDISDEEWRDTLEFIDTVEDMSRLSLIRGNHDTLLDPITDKRDVAIHDSLVLDGYLFCHGHEVPDGMDDADYIVMGHEHPAVGLRDGPRVELYKCFLSGSYDDTDVLVVPSISTLPEGTDVTQELLQSPLIEDIDAFEAYVIGDDLYHFGRVGEI